MATNKQAIIRYKALDKCFGNRIKNFYFDDLKKYVEQALTDYIGVATTVSKRQLFDDINFMKSEGGYQAPIKSYRSGKRVYYRYEEKDYSIYNQPLNTFELEQIQQSLETLGRVSGIPKFEWINSVQTKLSAGLNLDKVPNLVISFEENQFLRGLKFLEPLYQYIVHQKVLSIRYKGFKQEHEMDYIIHPYYLKQYNNRWFLFGWNQHLKSIQNLALDRIIEVSELSESYIDTNINFEEYFEDIVGVTNPSDQDCIDIELKFSEQRLPYVLSKPIHGSQRFKDGIVHIEVKINPELVNVLLSFGKDLEVLAPLDLRDKIKEVVLGMQWNYFDDK